LIHRVIHRWEPSDDPTPPARRPPRPRGPRGDPARAQTTPEFSADIPAKITTPDSVDTRIGTLRFQNGAPDADTVKAVYDNLDFMRGVQAFLTGMSATSVRAACNGLDSVGVKANQGIGLTEDLMDARSLFLTPNTTTVYGFACLDLTAGPMVLTVPPGVLGPVDDANFRWVNDVGLTGPDAGKGGSYLFVPPGYTGELPATATSSSAPRRTRSSSSSAPSCGTATSRPRSMA
jgi:hypothetical protein